MTQAHSLQEFGRIFQALGKKTTTLSVIFSLEQRGLPRIFADCCVHVIINKHLLNLLYVRLLDLLDAESSPERYWHWTESLVVPHQLPLGYCLRHFVPHSCWNSNYRSTQGVSHWRGPQLLNIVVLAMTDGLFGLCGSELADESFISTAPPPFPRP